MSIRLYLTLSMALLLFLTSFVSFASDIEIKNAWVRAAPPTVKVMAAYMSVTNHDNAAYTLAGASSPQFKTVEIHRTQMEGEMMRMKPVDEIELGAHKSIAFKPGGYHLMLVGPKKPLSRGEQVELTLIFNEGLKVDVKAEVKDDAGDMTHDMMHHHHH